jgi:hypothetical protein
LAAVAIGAVAFLLTRDDSSSTASPRYCDLTSQLLLELTSVGLQPSGPVPEVSREDVGKVLTQMGSGIDQLEDAAPAKVRGDTKTVVGALKKGGAGDLSEVRSAGFQEAERGMVSFLQTAGCGAGATPNAEGD